MERYIDILRELEGCLGIPSDLNIIDEVGDGANYKIIHEPYMELEVKNGEPDRLKINGNNEILQTSPYVFLSMIAELDTIWYLDIDYINLKTVPAVLLSMKGLKYLDLSYCNIERFDACEHSEIIWLTLVGEQTYFDIESLSFTSFPKLSYLFIMDYQFTQPLDTIGDFDELSLLALHNNNIDRIPEIVFDCKNLVNLSLSGNPIKKLPPEVRELSKLRFLSLDDTLISEIPEEILDLKELESLNLGGNTFKKIPSFLTDLNLPFRFEEVSVGKPGIYLNNVTLTEMDISLFEQPIEVIKAFYDKEQITLNEYKVVFLGDGEVGKTALADRIMGREFDEEKYKNQTNGISIVKHDMNIDDIEMSIRFWDFGGQEILHTMHKCFLTSRTLYVIVLNGRGNSFIQRDARYWLDTVNTFAPGCKVIIGINKYDLDQNAALDEIDLKAKYPNLCAVHKVSAKTNYNIDQLSDSIRSAISISDGFRSAFNAAWFKVKSALENMESPYISQDDYRELCCNFEVAERKIQTSLLDWFKDLGISYYYKADEYMPSLEEYTVLQPEWLTNGIYRLITGVSDKSGFIKHADIELALEQTDEDAVYEELIYAPREIEYILNVMRQFQISHQINNIEFIPLKCLREMKADVKSAYMNWDTLHTSIKGDYIPYNVIHRLMIEMYEELSLDTMWRYGAVFVNRYTKSSALVHMDERQIDIYVKNENAEFRVSYYEKIRERLWNIINSMVSTDKDTYMEELHYKIDGISGRVDFNQVIRTYRMGIEVMSVPNVERPVKPVELLRNIYSNENIKKMKEEVPMTQHIYNFNGDGTNSVISGDHNSGNIQSVNVVNSLPDGGDITANQMEEVRAILQSFVQSEIADDELNGKQKKEITAMLNEVGEEKHNTAGSWNKIKGYLTAVQTNAPTVIAAINTFISTSNSVTEWAKNIFK